MFDFMVDDIMGYADYLIWNDQICELNRQYHRKYHFKSIFSIGKQVKHGLYCNYCTLVVANWRKLNESLDINDKIIYDHRGYYHKTVIKGVFISKNY